MLSIRIRIDLVILRFKSALFEIHTDPDPGARKFNKINKYCKPELQPFTNTFVGTFVGMFDNLLPIKYIFNFEIKLFVT